MDEKDNQEQKKRPLALVHVERMVMPSAIFERAFGSGMGGCLRECACGITHFDGSDNDWDWEEGELERLEKLAEEHPDKYIGHDHSVGHMNIDGRAVVYECECGIAAHYEKFILRHEYALADYLNARATELRTTADAISVKA